MKLALALLVGCSGGPRAADAPDSELVFVRTWTEAGSTLVVQTRFDPGGEVTLPQPPADPASAMTFEPVGEPGRERIGGHEVVTQRWKWSATKGNYEIPALTAHWKGPESEADAASSPLFVDVDSEPLGREGDLADIEEPARVWTIPWRGIALAGGVGALLLGGVALAFRTGGRRGPVYIPPEPPDVVALRQWDAVRADPLLDDHQKAVQISRIFRVYAEVVLGFPATAYTTSEILARMVDLPHLPDGNVPRAKRLLRATDRVKFAGEAARTDLFDELDADLRTFIGSTRPHSWTPE